MNNKKMFLIIASIFALSISASAQQDILMSQYMFNRLPLNPGYAGNKDYMMATLLHRQQWVGWEGAPETNALSVHGRVGERNGLGFSLVNDKLGVTNRTDAYGTFSHHLRVSGGLRVGLGIQGGVGYYAFKNADLKYWENADNVYAQESQSNLLPNFGAGAFLYSKRFYFGFSVPHMIDYNTGKSLNVKSENVNPRQTRHYYAETGIALDITPGFVLKPSMLVRYVDNAPIQADLNMNALLANVFWIGATYRTNDAIVGIIELQATKLLRIGYAYDYTLTDIQNYSSGTHEIMIGIDFGYEVDKVKSPRFF